MRAKEVECNELAQERDRLTTQLAEQAELLKKAQKEAEEKESGLLVLRLLLGPLEQLLLLRQLHSQPVALLRRSATLLLPDAQHGFDFAQLLLKGGIGL